MEIQILGFGTDNTELYKESLNIRQLVFVVEFGFDKHVEFDTLDDISLHFILIYNGNPVGSARCKESENEFIIDRFCITSDFRGRGFGVLLIKYIISELIHSNKNLNSLSTVESFKFFERIGFNQLVKEDMIGSKPVKLLKYING